MKEIPVKSDNKLWLHIGVLLVAIGTAYSKVFHAGFSAWDDADYVFQNKDIKGLSWEHISAWFSHFYIGNYQPLTMASYAMDHVLGGDQPGMYHFTSLLLHACTAIVLYLLINRLQPNKMVGLFVALFFALHPVQTESVSWIAERKTLLCGLFSLLALLKYTTYLKTPTAKNLLIVCLLGVAAMLSKAVGVALPLSLLALDLWMARDLKSKKVWIEKIPLLIVAAVVGAVAVKAQASGHFLDAHPEYGGFDTVVYAGYAYVQYIVHFLVPVQLSVLYPYPEKLGVLQYLYLLVALLILALGVIAYRKKWYVLCGGIVFYTVNIMLLLQFVQFGDVLLADRYMYLACIGIIFPAVYYLFAWLQKVSKQAVALVTGGVVAAALLVMTFVRNDIWLSDLNFFNAISDADPNSAMAQYSIGALYMRVGNYAAAEQHMSMAVAIDPNSYKAWYNTGVLYLRERKPAQSLDALNKCLALHEYPKAYFSRALLYQGMGKPELAIPDIDKVIEDQPQNARAYFIKADCLEQEAKMPEAIDYYSKAIQYDGTDPLFYERRGMVYGRTRQNTEAISDLDKAVEMNPESGEALYYRGVIKYHSGQEPCNDLKAALDHGYKQAAEAIEKACKH